MKLEKIGEVLSEASKTQTLGLLLVMSTISFLFMLAAHRLYQKHYRLDEEEYKRICLELEKKNPGGLN